MSNTEIAINIAIAAASLVGALIVLQGQISDIYKEVCTLRGRVKELEGRSLRITTLGSGQIPRIATYDEDLGRHV